MHTPPVGSGKATGVDPADAQLETAVVRSIGGNQTGEFGRVGFTRNLVSAPQRHYFAITFHGFENTSFRSHDLAVMIALLASAPQQQRRTLSSTS
jgi:hypothetical protein